MEDLFVGNDLVVKCEVCNKEFKTKMSADNHTTVYTRCINCRGDSKSMVKGGRVTVRRFQIQNKG